MPLMKTDKSTLRPLRRVVTGLDSEGRSIIVSDGPAPLVLETPAWPGRGTTSFWTTTSAPASNGDEVLDAEVTLFPPMGGGGVSLMVMQIPPETEVESFTPEQRAAATVNVAQYMAEAWEVDTSQSYQMHATDTVDLLIMLAGELTLLVDDGEVTLKPFDVVIQHGVNHGWINRGKETALIASTAVDAKPLVRKRKGKRVHPGS